MLARKAVDGGRSAFSHRKKREPVRHKAPLMLAGFLLLSCVVLPPPDYVDSLPVTSPTYPDISDRFRALNGYFTENKGQFTDGVRFYSQGNPSVAFRDDGVMFVLSESEMFELEEVEGLEDRIPGYPAVNEPLPARSLAYFVRFEGANPVAPVGRGKLPFDSNFFFGSDPDEWKTDVPNFEEVAYQNLYDGIDLVYRSAPDGIKYEFMVHPGVDPGIIRMTYDGIESLLLDDTGLIVRTQLLDVRDTWPYSYQENGVEVRCRHTVHQGRTHGFDCERWKTTETLIIDPLLYSTYLGGTKGDVIKSIAVDAAGHAYVTGKTYSVDFPTTPGAFDTVYGGGQGDAFVVKLNADGSSLVYATFLAGNKDCGYCWERGNSIVVDSDGNAYVVGKTASDDFPTTPGAFDETFNGGYDDSFVTKLNPQGNGLVYSTYLGSSPVGSYEHGNSIAIDLDRNAYVTGCSLDDFPVTPGAYDNQISGGMDLYVTKLNVEGSDLVYSALFGGSKQDCGSSIAVDPAGNAYVSGYTVSTNFPTTPGAFDDTYDGGTSGSDAFVVKMNADGSALVYSTYLGGSSYEFYSSLAIDTDGNCYVTGQTYSSDFPVTLGANDTSFNGGYSDAYVSKLNITGTALVYSTFLGGSDVDSGRSITVDPGNNAYVTGLTASTDFPVTPDAFNVTFSGGADVFISKLSASGEAILSSTYLGGSKAEDGYSIRLDDSGSVYVGGQTWSTDFPITPGAFDGTYNGGETLSGDGIVVKLGIAYPDESVNADAGPDQTVNEGDLVQFDGSGSYGQNQSIFGNSTRVDDSPKSASNPDIRVGDDGTIHVVWADTRTWPRTNIYYTKSTDGGMAFLPSTPVSDNSSGTKISPAFDLDPNGGIHVAWSDVRNGNYDIYYANSFDGGKTFSKNTKVNDGGGIQGQESPDLAVDHNGDVHIAWRDRRKAQDKDIYYANSTDGGKTFNHNLQVTDIDGAAFSTAITSIAVDSTGAPHIAWEDQRNTPVGHNRHDIYHATFASSRDSFGKNVRVTDDINNATQGSPSIDIDAVDTIYLTWMDLRDDGNLSDYDYVFNIYFSRSLDGGKSFAPNTRLVDTGNTYSPSLAVDENRNLQIVWREGYAVGVIYHAVFTSNGDILQDYIQVDDVPDGEQFRPEIATDKNSTPHVVWFDDRSGMFDFHIYYSNGSFSGEEVLLYEWDFDASVDSDGDGNFTNDVDATGPTPTHVYYDDGVYIVTLSVTDQSGLTDIDTCNITVLNVAPISEWTSRSLDGTILNPPYPEGMEILFEATVYDPGIYDTFTFDWDFGDSTILLDAGPSVTHTYGDDDIYIVVLTVTDDDGGVGIDDTPPLETTNENPIASINMPFCIFTEGTSPCEAIGEFTDPGWLDTHSAVWNYGDGTYETVVLTEENDPPDATGWNITSHIYGDNGVYNLSFTVVDDDGGVGTAWAEAQVINLPPSVDMNAPSSVNEGEDFVLAITATDPGSDDLTVHIDWGDGTSETETHYNNGIGPDPSNSGEGVYPFTVYSNLTHTYGDNGNFTIQVTVEDDDGGSTQSTAVVEVLNLPPEIALPTIPLFFDEGEEFTLTAKVTDRGSDDIEFIWTLELGPSMSTIHYNDGVGPDPPLSPWGIFPFTAEDTVNHTYGDNGYYNVSIIVMDDDGGVSTSVFTIEVRNVDPSVDIGGPYAGDENSPIEFTATAVDPGSDDLTFLWDWGDGTTDAIAFYNDGVSSDPPKSPWGTCPFEATHTITHVWGDNGDFTVTLTVMDDDGAVTVEQTVVTISNVAPTVESIVYYLNASFSFRIAGEKWHNVEIHLFEDGTEIGYANITRYPGSPNDQMVTLADISIDFSKTYWAAAYYTPENDPVNGQIWGATPAWVIIDYEDGSEWIHHTFNVRHEDMWTWVIDDLSAYFLGHNITFVATASDPGSDDLTFTWDWGDGNTTENVYYNDGIGPDPYPSPEVNPISVTDTVRHGYALAGTYIITLTVTDDDGGVTSYSLNLTL